MHQKNKHRVIFLSLSVYTAARPKERLCRDLSSFLGVGCLLFFLLFFIYLSSVFFGVGFLEICVLCVLSLTLEAGSACAAGCVIIILLSTQSLVCFFRTDN